MKWFSCRNIAFLICVLAVIVAFLPRGIIRLQPSYPFDLEVGNVKEASDTVLIERFRQKNALIVGATRGIGRGIAVTLAKLGANVKIVGRSVEGGNAVVKTMLSVATYPEEQRFHAYSYDLSTVRGCLEFTNSLNDDENFDFLIMTIGVWPDLKNPKTADGIDKVVAIDLLARFVIFKKVQPLLNSDARVMSVLSSTSKMKILEKSVIKQIITGEKNDYGLANIIPHMVSVAISADAFLQQAGLRYPSIKFIGTHPGIIETDLFRNTVPGWVNTIKHFLFLYLPITITEEECGQIHANILSSPNVNNRQVTYFNSYLEGRKTASLAYDKIFGEWVWSVLEDMMVGHSG